VGFLGGWWGFGLFAFGFGAFWMYNYFWYQRLFFSPLWYPFPYWTPAYIPVSGYDSATYADTQNPANYQPNPDLQGNGPSDEALPRFTTNVSRIASYPKNTEQLSASQRETIAATQQSINTEWYALLDEVKADPSLYDYGRWSAQGWHIVPDPDRGRFVWIRQDASQQKRGRGSMSALPLGFWDGSSSSEEDVYVNKSDEVEAEESPTSQVDTDSEDM
jgi:hypothetical protein